MTLFNATTSFDQAIVNVTDPGTQAIVSSLLTGMQDGTLEYLDGQACREKYSTSFQTSYGNLIMNARDFPRSSCLSDRICHIQVVPTGGDLADYMLLDLQSCLVQKVEEHCSIRYSLPLAIIVTLFNATKVILLWTVALRLLTTPLITIGDAVSSFLEHPDTTTLDMCLMSRADFDGDRSVWRDGFGPRFYIAKGRRWSQAASRKQWVVCISLSAIRSFRM
jgi:hypothetical protein